MYSRYLSEYLPASGGGTTYTITPSGGITMGGVGIEVDGKFFVPSGGVTFGGTGTITFTSGGTTYTIIPSGGITMGGTATVLKGKFFIPNGGIGMGGTGPEVDTKIIAPNGGVIFGGTGSMTSNTSPVGVVSNERTKVGAGT